MVVDDDARPVAPDSVGRAGRAGGHDAAARRGRESHQQPARHAAGPVDERLAAAPAAEAGDDLARRERAGTGRAPRAAQSRPVGLAAT